MAVDRTGRSSQPSSILPPRKINVTKFAEARAAELESLHSIVSERANGDFRSQRNKRRRTTAYDSQPAKKRRRRLGGLSCKGRGSVGENTQKKVPRRVRRRIELRKNLDCGFSTSGDGTKWLRTHVWHAKRFTMTKLWGFHLPLGLHGRGRGSRAVLKRFKQGALVHDASYCSAVQLEASEESLLTLLEMVLEPSVVSHSEDVSRSILSGLTYGSGMLHSVGAPISRPIAPVTYMWRPCRVFDTCENLKGLQDAGQDDPESVKQVSQLRQLWLWIHASGFSTGYDTLKLACQKLMDERNILVKCLSLEGQLGKLEVIGSKVFQVLQKTLYPVTCCSEMLPPLRKCTVMRSDDFAMKFSDLEHGEQTSTRGIIPLTVVDPRILPNRRSVDVSKLIETAEVADVIECDSAKHDSVAISLEGKCLWDARDGIRPPEDESILCTEKHQYHMNSLCLDNPKSEIPQTKNKVQCSRCCPILLLRNTNDMGSPLGWCVILPLSWVRVFWNAFASKGAHAIGLREKHWVSCDVGLPFFPLDFPDCRAYASFMANEAAASDRKAKRCPPAFRPFKIPIPSPWNSVRTTLENASSRLHDDPKVGSEIKMSEVEDSSNNLFDGYIARTSTALRTFRKNTGGGNLPLVPWNSNGNTSFVELLKDGSSIKEQEKRNHRINYGSKLCFLRVHLHAYKEGSFEEGAVVCAPSLPDISLWTTSSGCDESGLKMPQSSVSSYFREQSIGKWDINTQDDLTTCESHRWPIGFVTTGFVRGSKKPTAVAFCEAVLLARLREEQWSKTPAERRKREIYVLVRNLRSNAYRLALATIVLEQQDQDVQSL